MQPYSEQLRDWCKEHGKILRERVLENGQHHVWFSLFPGCRIDHTDKDFERACKMSWIHLRACLGEPKYQALYHRMIFVS